jgi:hypothetical protein
MQDCGLTLVKNDYLKKFFDDRSGNPAGQKAMQAHDFDHVCFTEYVTSFPLSSNTELTT